MAIFANGETGLSVRNKINATITAVDARLHNYAARTDLKAWIDAANTPLSGVIHSAAGLSYRGSTGATTISDLPGLVPADELTAHHWPDTTAGLAAALTHAAGKTLKVRGALAGTLPASYPNTLLDYEASTAVRAYTIAGTEARSALRTFRAQHAGSHADAEVYSFHIETRPVGSGKNGPTSADIALSMSTVKRAYATGSAVKGEMDGMVIVLRQDGPDGFASGAADSSDAAAIMVNAQNAGTCGFLAAADMSISNIDRSNVITKLVKVQFGIIDANHADGDKKSYGYVTVAQTGTNQHAYYVGEGGGASWENAFYLNNKMKITADLGAYVIVTSNWPAFAAKIERPRGVNDALTIAQRGTGGIILSTVEAGSIAFATSGTTRMRVNASGALVPQTDIASNLGDASARWLALWAHDATISRNVILSGGDVRLTALPTAAPAESGRLWRDAAAGNVLKVVP